jgi:O-antigen/teichoic acid export membrane protein
VVLFLARYLGKNLFGLYGFIFAYLTIFDVIIDFGLTHILVRDISRDESKAALLVGNAFILRLFIVFLCLAASWITAIFLGYSQDVRFLIFVASFALFLQLRSIFEVIFRVRLKMQYPALETIIRASCYGLLVLLIIYFKCSLLFVLLANIISGVVGLAFLITASIRYLKPKLKLEPAVAKYLLKQSFPLMLSTIFIFLYYRIDVVMLSKMKSFTDIGFYTASTRLVESLVIFPVTIVISVLPVISEAFKTNKEIFRQICDKVFVFLFAIALPICILTTFFSRQIIGLLYGAEFQPAYLALRILIWADFFIFILYLSTQILISIEKQYVDAVISLCMISFNIILNLFLIPKFSYIGSSIAVLISVGLGAVLAWGYVLRVTKLVLPLREAIKIIFANLILVLASLLIFEYAGWNWILCTLLYGSVYCFLLLKLKILPISFAFPCK